jgi:serine/threonine protein kinase
LFSEIAYSVLFSNVNVIVKALFQNVNIILSFFYTSFAVYQFSYACEDSFSHQFPEQIRQKYHISRELGSGACGVVRLVYDRNTCNGYAMKAVKRNIMSTHTETRMRNRMTNDDINIRREISIMQNTDHVRSTIVIFSFC